MVHQMLSDGNLKFAQLLRNALVTKGPPGADGAPGFTGAPGDA
ncbi:hypothetical protein GBAR_LOCUS15525, partial [Geodia barretti]